MFVFYTNKMDCLKPLFHNIYIYGIPYVNSLVAMRDDRLDDHISIPFMTDLAEIYFRSILPLIFPVDWLPTEAIGTKQSFHLTHDWMGKKRIRTIAKATCGYVNLTSLPGVRNLLSDFIFRTIIHYTAPASKLTTNVILMRSSSY